ncbi:MAG: hypothetical protein ACQES9_06625 [Myxococcota bacterium]
MNNETAKILDGPEKKELWRQARQMDNWVAKKEITQLPVRFVMSVEHAQFECFIYLDKISTMTNSNSEVIFSGQMIDSISGDTLQVEGQYDFKQKSGQAWFEKIC